jgi:acetyl esterase/lipase
MIIIDDSLPGPHSPTLQYFEPNKKHPDFSSTAILILPGGAYRFLAEHEEIPPCIWLSSLGFSCFALRYRVGPLYKHPVQQLDLSKALSLIRTKKFTRIGVMGFSAGGHLACFAQDVDFRILCYPVIDFRQNESVCGAILEDSDDEPQRDAMLEHLTGI